MIPGSVEALRDLKALGVKLAVVSNADGSVEQQLRDDGIGQVGPGDGVELDAVLDSAVVGVAKPDPRIFELALERIGVPAARRCTWATSWPPTSRGPAPPASPPSSWTPTTCTPTSTCCAVRSLRDVVAIVTGSEG